MSARPFQALLIEDNPGDARLIREILREAGGEFFRLDVAERLRDGLELIRGGGIDVVLLDLSLPDSQGLETLTCVRAKYPMLAVVVLTGFDDEKTAVDAVREGAQDYLVKGRFDGNLLVRSMRYGIERKGMERALRASEERFRSLVKNSPVGIFMVRNGRIVYQNPEQKRLFGPMPEAFELRCFRDVHPEDEEKFDEFCGAVASGAPRTIEMELRFFPYGKKADGVDLRWVHCRTNPLESGGEPTVLVNMVDITRAREMEQIAIARDKMTSLGHVAAAMAHEIRNPLSGINMYVSMLEWFHRETGGGGTEGSGKEKATLESIRAASRRIESVVKKIMDFSKPAVTKQEPVDLNLAIDEAIDFSAATVRKRGVVLDRSRLERLPICRADRHLITQVLLNLITNADHAMENSEGPKVLRIASSMERDRIVIRVCDSGPGVPVPMREKIFDPFFTTKRDGYGIGLSFSRRVISDHGGTLEVGTGELGGAEFRIEMPLARADEPPE